MWGWQMGSVQNPQMPQRCEKIPLLLNFWYQQRPAKPNLSWQIECLASLGVTQKGEKKGKCQIYHSIYLSGTTFWEHVLSSSKLLAGSWAPARDREGVEKRNEVVKACQSEKINTKTFVEACNTYLLRSGGVRFGVFSQGHTKVRADKWSLQLTPSKKLCFLFIF